uniref:Uncharacterized protein n=2 Tax=Astyanax mexicanus TaxID=7994 RepID=A0A3B1JVZ7_ASTMX
HCPQDDAHRTTSNKQATMCRSDTFSYTVPAATRRSTEPEVFTFDRIHEVHALTAQQCARPAPALRRRPVRVLYPSTGRRYLPRAETSPAKRWLLALCLVVLLQIYAEDDVAVNVATDEVGASVARALPPFTSAEEEMKAATAAAAAAASSSSSSATCTRLNSWTQQKQQQMCPERAATSTRTWSVNEHAQAHAAQARARSGYVVALLYPAVYHHKLSSEQ